MNQRLTAIIGRDDDGYVALCPELDIASQGDSVELACENLREALELFFEVAPSEEVKRRLRGEVAPSFSGTDSSRCAGEAATSSCSGGFQMGRPPSQSPTISKELRIGTLQSIMRQSGLPRSEFES